jgi:hypothetical protein
MDWTDGQPNAVHVWSRGSPSTQGGWDPVICGGMYGERTARGPGESSSLLLHLLNMHEPELIPQDEYLSAGADGIIPKPVHQKTVLEQIREARKRVAGETKPKPLQSRD